MPKTQKLKIETALTFENPADDSALQIEMDTNGYSVTIFDAEGNIATMELDRATLARFATFTNALNKEIN